MSGRYDHLSEKSRGYAEGVVAGFKAAQETIEKLTGGLLTLNMPREVRKWDYVVRELGGSRARLGLMNRAPTKADEDPGHV